MKKIILLIVVSWISVFITSCSSTEIIDIAFKYDEETRVCTVKNNSSGDYEQLQLTIALQNKDGFEKEIKHSVELLEAEAEYEFEISEINQDTEIQNVILKEYTYDVDASIIFGALLFALLIIAIFIFLW